MSSFGELAELGAWPGPTRRRSPDFGARYAVDSDPDSIPRLVERFGLRFRGEPIR